MNQVGSYKYFEDKPTLLKECVLPMESVLSFSMILQPGRRAACCLYSRESYGHTKICMLPLCIKSLVIQHQIFWSM